jgi:class 3 adenylate cyclase
VVDAMRFAVEVQTAMIERNAGVPEDTRIQFRVGIHLGDVVEESDGDLMGDGVNPPPGWSAFASVCLSERAYWLAAGTDRASGASTNPASCRGFSRRRAIAPYRVRRISSNTAQRTSIRFGSYTWNMQGGLLP